MAVISQLSIPMPNGVPITIQVFGIALIGVTLGWRLGCLSAVIYLLIGAVGLPVFANFGGGVSRLVSLTGGYLWSYPLMAALCGIHPNTGNQKKDTALILLSFLLRPSADFSGQHFPAAPCLFPQSLPMQLWHLFPRTSF